MPKIIEIFIRLFDYLVVYSSRNTHTTRLSQLLYSRCQINAIPIDVATIMNHFTQIDTDPELK